MNYTQILAFIFLYPAIINRGLALSSSLNSKSDKTIPERLPSKASNVLFIIGMSSHSHRTAIEPLAHELVARGHNVTFLTPVKATKPNSKFHEFSTPSVDQFYNEVLTQIGDDFFPARLQNKYSNAVADPLVFSCFMNMGAELYLNSPEFKPWTESSSFDLVIIDNPGNAFGQAVAYKFKAQVILFTPAGFWLYEEQTFGIPSESSWLPNFFVTNVFTEKLTFQDKLSNTLYPLYSKLLMEWWTIPKLDELTRRALEVPEMPSIVELEQETSLIFTNQYFPSDYARSLPPLVVQIGGMYCENSKAGSLPKKIEDFITGAGDEGFVYISFGTIINMSKMPDYLLQIFFDTIKSFPRTRFLWKWDIDPPKNLPSNVFAANWFPQQDVLAHPKIKGFMTHGGLMSVQQSVYHSVPMIVIPVFGDQPYNAKSVAYHKIGIHLELSELTADVLEDALRKLISDSMYSLKAKRVSEQFKDRPLTAIDTAVYWTEYVLRHKNTSHLKPLAMKQSWWERRLLDVWLFLLASCCIILFVLFKVITLLIGLCFNKARGNNAQVKLKKQ